MLYAVFTFEYQNIRGITDLISKVSKGFEIKLPKGSAIIDEKQRVFSWLIIVLSATPAMFLSSHCLP